MQNKFHERREIIGCVLLVLLNSHHNLLVMSDNMYYNDDNGSHGSVKFYSMLFSLIFRIKLCKIYNLELQN